MTDYPNNDRAAARPSVAEIAALTRRLRELSAPGRAVDPGERAAFLADKDALIARITDTDAAPDSATDAAAGGELHRHIVRTGRTDAASDAEWWARAESTDPTAQAATFSAAGYYTDAHLAAIAHARAAGDTERAERLQDAPWSTPADQVQVARMPDWMREQARRTEAAIADGTYVASAPDDMARLAARLAALRGNTAEEDTTRREQLTRWHTDDTTDAVTADDVRGEHIGGDGVHGDDGGSGGPLTAMDDGPGLP